MEEANQEEKEDSKEETIEVTKGGKLRKIKVKRINIEWEGKEEEVLIKRMCFGERAEFTEKFLKINITANNAQPSINMKEMQIETVLMGLQKAPFPITRDYIEYELEGDIGEKLHKEIDKFNKLTPTIKKNSDGQSSTEQLIQPSTSSSTTSD